MNYVRCFSRIYETGLVRKYGLYCRNNINEQKANDNCDNTFVIKELKNSKNVLYSYSAFPYSLSGKMFES